VTYEYKCDLCGHVHERFGVSMKDRDKPVSCPECNGACTRRLSPVSHHFKRYKRFYGKRIDEGLLNTPRKGVREI